MADTKQTKSTSAKETGDNKSNFCCGDSEEMFQMMRKFCTNQGENFDCNNMRATVCHNCPLCNHARKNPDSKIGKILHHRYHADNCPLWKAEKEVYGQQ